MPTTWSRPVVEVVVFSNEGLRKVVNAMLYISHTGLTVALSARGVRALDPGVVTVRRWSRNGTWAQAPCLGPRLPGGLNTGSSSAHCSFVTSLGYDMPRTVLAGPADAVAFE